MTDLLIRDVPVEVHEALKAGAERNGQSLQQYVRAQLVDAAQRSSVEMLFAEVLRAHGSVDVDSVIADVAASRAERDSRGRRR